MLLVFEIQGQRNELALTEGELSIGSAPGNDLFLLGAGLSAHHGVVRREGSDLFLIDLGSKAGTRLNGSPLTPNRAEPLRCGDRIDMGRLALSVVGPETAEQPSGPQPGAIDLLLDTITDLHEHPEPDAMLPVIVDRVIQLTGADRGLLLLRGQGGLETTVARDHQGEIQRVEGTSQSIPRRVLETGAPVSILGDDPQASEARSESMKEHDLHAILCLPIRSRGSVVGVVYVDSRGEAPEFGPHQRQLLEAFAAQCGIALERARVRRLEVAERQRLEAENAALRKDAAPDARLTSANPGMRQLLRDVERVARSDVRLLITGETGVGKELLARFAHAESGRPGPFVVVDCGAIPETLLESTLFGHRAGAFTGATVDNPGLVAQAQDGTLMLDEIGELPLDLQPKLLRFLEERTYHPVGGDERLHANARIIACTHRNLQRMVEAGRFRQDLYYRLSGFPLTVPPLRERPEDLLPLASILLGRARRVAEKPRLTGFTHEAQAAIRAYTWPGNVRELAHRIERAGVLAEPPFVTVPDLDLPAAPGSTAGLAPLKAARREATDRFEREYVSEMLRRHRGVVTRAAQEAEVSRQMFQRLMAKHGLSRDAFVATGNT